jgi:hypothetical protein
MDYNDDFLGVYEEKEAKAEGKHCNECGAHWMPDDDVDPDQFVHCIECGSDDIEDCSDSDCVKSSMAEENRELVSARQEYPGRLLVSKRKNKKGVEEDFVEHVFKTYTGEELRLGDYDKNGYRMIGVGVKGLEAVMALWITPQGKGNPMLKMDAGVTFKGSSPYFEGYSGDMDRATPFPAFREGKDKSGTPFGTRTSLDNFDAVVELFEAQCDKYGCKKEPRIWSGAARAVEDAKAVRTSGGGGGRAAKALTASEILDLKYVNGELGKGKAADEEYIRQKKILLG